MKRLILALSLALAATLFFVAGLWLGVREGSKLTLLAEKPPQGVIALRVIEISKEGARPDQIRTVLEMWIDHGLVGAYKYLNSPLRPLFERPDLPDLGPLSYIGESGAHMEEWATKLANYRKEHPSPMPAWRAEFGLNDEAVGEEIAARRREDDRIVKLMVERYATK